MKLKFFFMGITFFVVAFIFLPNPTSDDTPQMSPNEAIKTALPFIQEAYPQSSSSASEYEADYAEGTWTVGPKIEGNQLGGGASADLSDSDGSLIRTYFSE